MSCPKVVLISDSGPIPSYYVRFADTISLITTKWAAYPFYDRLALADICTADVVIVQRWLNGDCLAAAQMAKVAGIPLIYETDDNLLDLSSQSSSGFSSEHLYNIRTVTAMADMVICSTEPLAVALRPFNSNVRTIKNYALDKGLPLQQEVPHLAIVNTDYFKLEDNDKSVFFDALERAVCELNYKVSFFGTPDPYTFQLMDRFPESVQLIRKTTDERNTFLDIVRSLGVNVAAAPLSKTRQHSYKSDIKFLDFASLSVPCIFNNDQVYSSVTNGKDGILCTDCEWFSALQEMADAPKRISLGLAANCQVRTERSAAGFAAAYRVAIEELTSKRAKIQMVDENSGLLWLAGRLYLKTAFGSLHHVADAGLVSFLLESGCRFLSETSYKVTSVGAPVSSAAQIVNGGLFKATRTTVPVELRSSRAEKRRHAQPSDRLRIGWIVPNIIIGGGGHRNIIRCAYQLESLGHFITLYFKDTPYAADELAAMVRTHFYPLRGNICLVDDTIGNSDILFVTHWSTVQTGDLYKDQVGEIIYFVQDFEPSFYQFGTEYVEAENTYKKGLYAITSGIWCEDFLRTRFGMEADHFTFPIDKTVYFDCGQDRKKRILYFAKPEMPRRCFSLGLEALRLFHQQRPDVEVVMFGSGELGGLTFDFPVTILGLLGGPSDLADLYRTSMCGVVFSTTNPSLVPYEMMACGLPVLDLARKGNELNYGGSQNVAKLVLADPESMAAGLAALVADDVDRFKRTGEGLLLAAKLPEEKDVGLRINSLLIDRVRRWS